MLRHFRELQRSALVKIGQLAMQAEVRKDERIVRLLQELIAPSVVSAQLNASLDPILLYSENACAGLVQLVDFPFFLDPDVERITSRP